MTAANDRRRGNMGQRRRRDQAGRHPAIESRARKQPAPGYLGAGHGALSDQLIKLALGQAQVRRGLVGGE